MRHQAAATLAIQIARLARPQALSHPTSPAFPWGLGIILSVLVVVVTALSPLLGVPVFGHNFGHDADYALTALHFMDNGIREGRWWPRWVMETNFGLGGLTFLTYPPVAYWVGAAVKIASGLSVEASLTLSLALWRLAFLGGCFLWLRRHVSPGAALAAAALAAMLPYQALINPWIRFSYAEVAGAALVPFLLRAIEHTVESHDSRGIPYLALVFGTLAMTHLPSCALLAHLALIYGWAYGGPRGAMRTLAGGIGGAGLAACFVLPAAVWLKDANFGGLDDGLWETSLMFYGGLKGTDVQVRFLLMVWAAGWTALLLSLGFRWLGRAMPPSPLRRAAMVLLLASFALMTVMTLPLWILVPQLRAIEFPWRATGLLSMSVAVLVALALDGGIRLARPLVLAFGLSFALLTAAFVGSMVAFGNPGWPRFLPAQERLDRALATPRGTSSEHLPIWAVKAGWLSLWLGPTETEHGPEPFARPVLPAGTQRIPGGFVVPKATTSFSLPQFYFPAWQATDGDGQVLAVRPGPDAFLEVVIEHPVTDVRVVIRTTRSEWIGLAVSGLTAAILLVLWRRRAVSLQGVAV